MEENTNLAKKFVEECETNISKLSEIESLAKKNIETNTEWATTASDCKKKLSISAEAVKPLTIAGSKIFDERIEDLMGSGIVISANLSSTIGSVYDGMQEVNEQTRQLTVTTSSMCSGCFTIGSIAFNAMAIAASSNPSFKPALQNIKINQERKRYCEKLLQEISSHIAERFVTACESLVTAYKDEHNTQAAHSFADVLRDVLSFLAPPEEVMKAKWYRQEDPTTKVIQKQKIKFALVGYDEINVEPSIISLETLMNEGRTIYTKFHRWRHPNGSTDYSMLSAEADIETEFLISLLESRKKVREFSPEGNFYEPLQV